MHLARVRIRVRVRVMVRVRVRARARARVRCEQCTAQAPCGLERVGVRLLAVMRARSGPRSSGTSVYLVIPKSVHLVFTVGVRLVHTLPRRRMASSWTKMSTCATSSHRLI